MSEERDRLLDALDASSDLGASWVTLDPSQSDLDRVELATETAKRLLSGGYGFHGLTPEGEALMATALCFDIYQRESRDPLAAVGHDMLSSGGASPIPALERDGSLVVEEKKQSSILQGLREDLFIKEDEADPGHKTTYAYSKIIRSKSNEKLCIFVAKGTDRIHDWLGQNVKVNGRFSNLSPHLAESTERLLKHFLSKKGQQFEYLLTGHSLAGHLVQQLSAMIFGLSKCKVDALLLRALAKKINMPAEDLQLECLVLFSKITAVWAVDPPGTHHIIESFLLDDMGLDGEMVTEYLSGCANTHSTFVGRVNLVNRMGKQLVKPWVITKPYFEGDKGYDSKDLSPVVTEDLERLHGNVASHNVRDMMNACYRGDPGLVHYDGNWGDQSNWTTMSRVAWSAFSGIYAKMVGLFSKPESPKVTSAIKALEPEADLVVSSSPAGGAPAPDEGYDSPPSRGPSPSL